jgi:hypothetical protein
MDREGRLVEGRMVDERVTETRGVGRGMPPDMDFDPEEDPERDLEGGLDELTEEEVQALESRAVDDHGAATELEIESGEVDELQALAHDEDDEEDEEGGV